MRILVTGVKGQLGHDVIEELKKRKVNCVGVDIEDFDITDSIATERFIDNYQPNAIIHCSAYTAVDRAEDDLELCRAVNTEGALNIARACRKMDAKMIYISTDYVFPGGGEAFYETNDPTGPLGVYGNTKLEGELGVKRILERYFIVRTSWVFGKNGNNFIKTMLKLGESHNEINVVCDQIGSPTYTADLASLLCDMIVTNKFGTYHATNEGICSWAEFASEVFKIKEMPVKVNPIKTEEYPSKAKRPQNSRLSKNSLDDAGFKRLPEWKDAVRRYLEVLSN